MRTNILRKQKLNINFAVALILSLSFLVSVSAQSKSITKEEIETVEAIARQKLKNISYRSVTSEKIKKTEVIYVYEFVPPNRAHYTFTTKFAEYLSEKLDMNINKYEEWICVGEKVYFRNAPNKNWKTIVSDLGGCDYEQGTRTFSKEPNKTIEYKLTPNQLVNQRESELYEVIESYKYSWSSEPIAYHYKYWINKNGLFAKTLEQSSEDDREITVDYEYDSNIKIEVPLIKNKKRK